jgi:hypothetical protein
MSGNRYLVRARYPARLAALQREIRTAGDKARRTRVVLRAGIGMLISLPLLAIVLRSIGWQTLVIGTDGLFIVGGIIVYLCLGIAGCLVASPVAAAYRRCRQAQLCRKLEALPREERAQVLLPLQQDDDPDVLRLVRPLITALRPEGVEIVPAEAPAGKGSELVAAQVVAARATEGIDLGDGRRA